jgi:SAM-dependent methyltransferase
MIAACGAREGTHILDLCTGHGPIARALVDSGASVTGLDFSSAMLDLARGAVPEATFVEGDAADLPFDEGSFDGVTMGFGILHLPDVPGVFSEVARVLKPGGRFVLSCWHGPERPSVLPAFFKAAAAHADMSLAKLPPGEPAFHYAQPENTFPLLEAAGFAAPELRSVASFWTCPDAETPAHYFENGTVRGAALMRSQPEDRKRAIRSDVAEWVKTTCASTEVGQWHVPIPAAIISAQRV